MPKIKKQEPAYSDRYCHNCANHKMRSIDDKGQWNGVYICISEKANPDRKDPKDGNGFGGRKGCKFWEW